MPTVIRSHVTEVNGLLKFNDKESFDFVVKTLRSENNNFAQEIKKYCDNYSLRDEERNRFISANSKLVYKTFEDNFGFSSLRKKIEVQIKDWLNHPVLDTINDPDNHCILGDEYRTIFNVNGEIMLGNSIYIIRENWSVFEISNEDFKTLDKFRLSGYNPGNCENIITLSQESKLKTDDCKANTDKVSYDNYATGYQAKCRVTITNVWPFWHYVKSELTNYKLNTQNGNWEQYQSDNEWISVAGKIRDTQCTLVTLFTLANESQGNIFIDVTENFGAAVRAQNGEVFGDYEVNGTTLPRVYLNW